MTWVTDVYPLVQRECQILGLTNLESNLSNFQRLWLPLALSLREKSKPFIQGILAPQGTGKTTLTRILKIILNYWGVEVATLSIDDLYKTYGERQELFQKEPRLIWRGPPGTHDIDLGKEVIANFKAGKFPLLIPRFDKSLHDGQGDRISPIEVKRADILLFEGWFVGMKPIVPQVFDTEGTLRARSLDPIMEEDDREFARDCNERLKDYLPLWQSLDELLILYPLDYRWSLRWRQEAERKMRLQGKAGMTDAEIEHFVKYFWQALHPEIYLKPLLEEADIVVEIKNDRSLGEIYGKNRVAPLSLEI